MDRSFQGLVLSLCFHILLVLILLHGGFGKPVPQNDTTEVTFVERSADKKSKPMLIDPDNQKPDPVKDFSKEADFLSQFTKRVKKRLAVRNIGPTQNAQPQRPQGDREGIAGDQKRGDGDSGFLQPGGGALPRTMAIGQSSLSQVIPGVEEGSFTALNTDQMEFYAFYQRSNEQIRNRWVSLIRSNLDQRSARDMEVLSKQNRTTQVEIFLTPAGEFAHSVLHSSSGDRSLDQAAVESFRIASPFPNPPQEMVKSDGYIHLYYAFTLYLRPPNFGPAVN